ncbi:hypothetical protein CAPTEDRAFT_148998 [Capitella teleta]|uniref:Guanylate cyclase domain-containing protein n=1 Tax=Capitella teleta TaxID=283909 RepID=R7VIV0_CAPTE|nr:hypothetical protein CAPTEDRAFT_148998 [Capitella teleta]|eukprot:ELU15640.1 hypothetical protein CAPTEDRAFT_148998 [Capitella teleta]
MLPKSVARQLKFGKSVHAKQYEATTVYFSDIADFADISSTSEPMQVVTFLNNVYSFMDAKMNMYDVYKMETIGSVYMVVSGVPVSNGQRHVVEIANLAVDILQVTEDFVIPHMPLRPLRLRIGIHSGSCCAGVVGNKMPRYCLFGDTINTASRMQSYGLPGKIHVSKGTRDLLEEVGGFVVEPRGRIDIKGKGDMATFWLVSKINPKNEGKKRGVVLQTDSSREAWMETA